ncbi:Protein AIR2 [Spathaspora sp. JA1]|nr:Protein AIR2 [Spathaspora sp. JA1]
MSNLPFVEDTVPTVHKRSKYKPTDSSNIKQNETTSAENPTSIVSLSFDQVNDDASELIELRGEGRYFGVTDPDDTQPSLGPLCANCHKRGHIRAKCKTVVCHKCGVVGDHYENHCPTTLICGRCGEKGHIVAFCKSKVKKRAYCRNCDTFSHGDENCPSIWRSYLTKPTNDQSDEESLVLPVTACYNCGSGEHYGDECPQPRTSRVPNLGTAFSGSNLPRKYRPIYFLRLKRENNGNSKYNPESSVRDYYAIQEESQDYFTRANNQFSNRNQGFGNAQFNSYGNHSNSGKYPPRNYGSRSGYSGSKTITPRNGSGNDYNNRNSNKKFPTRSGFIQKSNGRTPETGNTYGNTAKPTRSGLIENSKVKKKKKAKIMKY